MRTTAGGAVLVTGASSGIGRAIAIDLAVRGVTVFAGVRRAGDAPTVPTEAGGPSGPTGPGRVHEVLLDITNQAHVRDAMVDIRRLLGGERLRGVVNNAGIAVGGPLEYLAVEDMRRQFEVNVLGQLAVTQAAVGLLRAHGDGRVLFMGSVNGRVTMPFVGPYAASKHALNGMAYCLRQELRPWNIQVSVLAPGAVATPIWDKARDHADHQMSELSPRAQELYGEAMRGMRHYIRYLAPVRGIAPDVVVRVVRKALYARRAHAMYLIGTEARAGVILFGLMPERVFEALLSRYTR